MKSPQILTHQPDRTLVMGVLNLTPDSFSDGGQWLPTDRAVAHARELIDQGADVIDIGGESTRPGAPRVSKSQELERIIPVITEVAAAGITVSVDTMRVGVAQQAVAAGATIVNDVSGGLADPQMAETVAALDVPYVAMHWRGHSAAMDDMAQYENVTDEVVAHLAGRVGQLQSCGVRPENIIVDPGFGFAKLPQHNWQLLAQLDRVAALGYPMLIGTSRKRFLTQAVTAPLPDSASVAEAAVQRDHATAATSVIAALAGAWAVRVHQVAASADAVRVVAQLRKNQAAHEVSALASEGAYG